ncbi:MAG: hypothetical protein Q9160_001821 [Pyrenula sp. 1 TL-2023]
MREGKETLNVPMYQPNASWRDRTFSDASLLSDASSGSYFSDISEASTSGTSAVLSPFPSPYLAVPQPRSKPPMKIILGTASFGSEKAPQAKFNTVNQAMPLLKSFQSRGYLDIDTARAYPVGKGGTAETLLGSCDSIHTWSNISTKVASFMPGSHRPANITRSIEQSLEALNAPYGVDIMYLHAPDHATPYVETLSAMNAAYQEGAFQRLGLSNYSASDVEKIVRICEENCFVKPSVYQGQYNAICRSAEAELFTVLRRHNIAFYAYSPTACGFFSGKVSRQSTAIKGSRWDQSSYIGRKYSKDYFHDELFATQSTVIDEADYCGISGHAAALRWTVYHSALDAAAGDAVVLGASSVEQMEENLNILEEGPLPPRLAAVMGEVWDAAAKGPNYTFC